MVPGDGEPEKRTLEPTKPLESSDQDIRPQNYPTGPTGSTGVGCTCMELDQLMDHRGTNGRPQIFLEMGRGGVTRGDLIELSDA
ncbi:hypothetical protein GX50_03273 [[Emmonsia] crescens]|uniref:Uncharacterized protein n=1 Tax=[Emmonsia] crescens TaxID=73230 RepID=A0A2B7ZL15_9EURO|nr:hypothetical protein GX50_03273 [Emmonsia crescens]